jgi:hypothetical protein
MSNKITKEYVAFMADGFKTWSDNVPMLNVVVSNHQTGTWTTIELTLEEAQSAVEILQAAIEEAKSLPDHKPWNDLESDSPF